MNLNFLEFFGVEITPGSPLAKIESMDPTEMAQTILAHRVVVLRGFQEPSQTEMLAFCKRLGKIRQWESGALKELKVRDHTENLLMSNRALPFHWDGSFAFNTPHFIFLHCSAAPETGMGGETIFCDTASLLARATEKQRALWERISITYTPKNSDGFTSPLIGIHPVSGKSVIHYAEPVEDLDGVRVQVHNLKEEEWPTFFDEMRSVLYDPSCWYLHSWKRGDVVIADNYAVLHARRAFVPGTNRHLTKINIL